jgi:hypothetical protein
MNSLKEDLAKEHLRLQTEQDPERLNLVEKLQGRFEMSGQGDSRWVGLSVIEDLYSFLKETGK